MDAKKKKRLEAAGFKSGTVAEFLALTPEESAVVEARVALARLVRAARADRGLTQAVLAGRMESSQSRMAKVEAGDEGVSLDLLVKAAVSAGVTLKEIGQAIAAAG
jgi:ribosome-binding protein aMBF1 (putative translation factor)